MKRTPIKQISDKRLREKFGGKIPRSSIAPKSFEEQRRPRKKKPRSRNRARQASEFARCFHSKARVEFIKSLSCVATGQFGTEFDPIDNAHVCDDGTKGTGRRSGYACIAPLKRSAHRLLHANPEKFAAKYGPFDWTAMAAYTERQWQNFAAAGGV